MKSRQWANRRNMQRKTRRYSQPTLLEPIEPRVLLSASYAPSDLSGTLVLAGINKSGSLTATGAGVFSEGSWYNADASPVNTIVGGESTYTVATDGTLTAEIVTSQIDVPGTTTTEHIGIINSTKDVVILNEMSGDIPVANGLDVLVGQNSFFTQDAFTGTWNVVGDKFRGSINVNASGHITGGALTLLSGGTARVTGGDAPMDNDGGGIMTINTTFRGSNAAYSSLTLNFVMNNSKDFVAIQNTKVGLGGTTGIGTLAALIRKTTGNSRADLAPLTWTINSGQGIGTLNLSPRGAVTGQFTSADGSTATLGGTLSVGSTGNVTLNLTVHDTTGTSRLAFSGSLNRAKNIIALDRTSKSTESSLTFLTTATNHAPTVSAKALFPQAAHIATPFTMSFEDLQSAINVHDLDNDTTSLLIATVNANAGTLTITSNGSTTDVIPGATVVSSGDILTWTPSNTVRGKVNAFSLQASDGTALSTTTTKLSISTIPIPVASVAPVTSRVLEVKAGTSAGKRLLTISRTGNTSTELTLTISLAGTALPGTNFNLVAPDGTTLLTDGSTVTIPAHKASIQLSVLPLQDGSVDPTLTVIVSIAPDPNALTPAYTPGTRNTATVNIIDSGP